MRQVSPTFLRAALARETGEAAVVLVTITHASLTAPIRVAGYDVDVTSRGETFVAMPFSISLPTDTEDAAPRAKVGLDNVSREIVIAVRNATGAPPSVTLEVVLASTPDVVEASFPGFALRSVTYNALTVEGELTLEGLATEPFPKDRFTPGNFPGVH